MTVLYMRVLSGTINVSREEGTKDFSLPTRTSTDETQPGHVKTRTGIATDTSAPKNEIITRTGIRASGRTWPSWRKTKLCANSTTKRRALTSEPTGSAWRNGVIRTSTATTLSTTTNRTAKTVEDCGWNSPITWRKPLNTTQNRRALLLRRTVSSLYGRVPWDKLRRSAWLHLKLPTAKKLLGHVTIIWVTSQVRGRT